MSIGVGYRLSILVFNKIIVSKNKNVFDDENFLQNDHKK
jgi:hypothetical protein